MTDTQQPASAPLNQEVERGKEQEKSQTNLKSCMKMTWPDAVPRWDVGSRFCIHLPSLLSDAITAVRCRRRAFNQEPCAAGTVASSSPGGREGGKTRKDLKGLSKEVFGTFATAAADKQALNLDASGESSSLPAGWLCQKCQKSPSQHCK